MSCQLYKLQNGKKVDTQIITLFQKYVGGECNQQELDEVFRLLKNGDYPSEWQQVIDQEADRVLVSGLQSDLSPNEVDQIYAGIADRLPSGGKRVIKLWPRIAVAASVAIAVMIGGYFYYNSQILNHQSQTVNTHDIAPGKNGATLTLANGQKILINDAVAGNIAMESGVKITKSKDGQLTYEVTGDGSGEMGYNTLSTSRGQQSKVRLPDGTMVFLNAESSLRYPTSFAKLSDREVFLSGEGYFEVFKDKSRPFRVNTSGQQVEVLGTHFNINAYEDSNLTKTTLVEGSIKVTSAGKNVVLRPNQEAVLNDRSLMVEQVDAELALAWKNGFFLFSSEPLESIMNKVSRWYNVEVVYADPSLRKEKFTGTLDRSENISEVIALLEGTDGVKVKVSGKKLTIEKTKE